MKRSYALSGSAVMNRVGLELVRLSALNPLSGQEKWRRLAGSRLGFIALYLKIAAMYNQIFNLTYFYAIHRKY